MKMSHLLNSRKRKRKSSKMWSHTTNLHGDSCMQFADRVGLVDAAAKGLNFVFSPLSIRTALSLGAAGAKGPTLDEFLSFLGFSTINDLNSVTKNLLAAVQIMRGGHTNEIQKKKMKDADRCQCGGSHLSFAHGVWVDRSMALKPSFKEVASSVYDAEANSVDFKNQEIEVNLVITDYCIPGMTGYDLLKKIKESFFVYLSAHLSGNGNGNDDC